MSIDMTKLNSDALVASYSFAVEFPNSHTDILVAQLNFPLDAETQEKMVYQVALEACKVYGGPPILEAFVQLKIYAYNVNGKRRLVDDVKVRAPELTVEQLSRLYESVLVEVPEPFRPYVIERGEVLSSGKGGMTKYRGVQLASQGFLKCLEGFEVVKKGSPDEK